MNIAVLVFPGSSGELDCYKAVQDTINQPVDYVRHTETNLDKYDAIIVPGGASYGNALRPGALARWTPVMEALTKAAEQGKYIIGISNGFQILLEAGLLPGAMLRNRTLKFRCQQAALRVETARTPWTRDYKVGEIVDIPVAHGEGNYYCDEATLAELKANDQIVFRYEGDNPDGSLDAIAGICSKEGNVVGMMPHPERAVSKWLGSEDGVRIFTSILNVWREKHGTAATGNA